MFFTNSTLHQAEDCAHGILYPSSDLSSHQADSLKLRPTDILSVASMVVNLPSLEPPLHIPGSYNGLVIRCRSSTIFILSVYGFLYSDDKWAAVRFTTYRGNVTSKVNYRQMLHLPSRAESQVSATYPLAIPSRGRASPDL